MTQMAIEQGLAGLKPLIGASNSHPPLAKKSRGQIGKVFEI